MQERGTRGRRADGRTRFNLGRTITLLIATVVWLVNSAAASPIIPKPRAELSLDQSAVVVYWRVPQVKKSQRKLEVFKKNVGSNRFTLVKRVNLSSKRKGVVVESDVAVGESFKYRVLVRSRFSKAHSKFSQVVLLPEKSDLDNVLPDQGGDDGTNQVDPPQPPVQSPTPTPQPEDPGQPDPVVGVTGSFLVPGAGFDGMTVQPQSLGAPSDPGYAALAIIRWTTIPYQVVDEQLNIGVLAFHKNGIEKVSFSANGGEWVSTDVPKLNPSSGIVEYFVTLKASDFADGPVEIRAIAWPKGAGKPRVLQGAYQANLGASPSTNGEHSLVVWANGSGSYTRAPRYVSGDGSDEQGDGTLQAPFRTITKAAQTIQAQYGSLDGAKILCLPGIYEFKLTWGSGSGQTGRADERMFTIAAAPGVLPSQVILTDGRPKVARIKLSNVSVTTNDDGNFYTGYVDLRPVFWIDDSIVSTKLGRYASTQSVMNYASLYLTNSTWTDAPDGPVGAVLVANSIVTKLRSDMVSNSQVVVNVQGQDIDPANTGAHPDVYQIYRPSGGMDNHIIYNLYAHDVLAQGIFIAALAQGEKIKNCAFVNVLIRKLPSNFTSQINTASEHLIFSHVTLHQTLFIRTNSFQDVQFVGNLFSAVTLDLSKTSPTDVEQIEWSSNHFVDVTSYGTYQFGTEKTTGAAPVVNWNDGDYRPLHSSILSNRLARKHSSIDVLLAERGPMTAVGAHEELAQ